MKHSCFVKFHLQKVSAQPSSALWVEISCCLKIHYTVQESAILFGRLERSFTTELKVPEMCDRFNSMAISGETEKSWQLGGFEAL